MSDKQAKPASSGEAKRLCRCGHPESDHETVEYRGDKSRWCQNKPCACKGFSPKAEGGEAERLAAQEHAMKNDGRDGSDVRRVLGSTERNLATELEKSANEVQFAFGHYSSLDPLNSADTAADKMREAAAMLREQVNEMQKRLHVYAKDMAALEHRAEQAEAELAAERETSINDPAEQRAERYAMEAYDLAGRLMEAERELAAIAHLVPENGVNGVTLLDRVTALVAQWQETRGLIECWRTEAEQAEATLSRMRKHLKRYAEHTDICPFGNIFVTIKPGEPVKCRCGLDEALSE